MTRAARGPSRTGFGSWGGLAILFASVLIVALGIDPAVADSVPPPEPPPIDALESPEVPPISPSVPAGDSYPLSPEYPSGGTGPLGPPPVSSIPVLGGRPPEVDALRAALDAARNAQANAGTVSAYDAGTGVTDGSVAGAPDAAASNVAGGVSDAVALERTLRTEAFLALVHNLLFGPTGRPATPVDRFPWPGHCLSPGAWGITTSRSWQFGCWA